jgi:hypothetical protein
MNSTDGPIRSTLCKHHISETPLCIFMRNENSYLICGREVLTPAIRTLFHNQLHPRVEYTAKSPRLLAEALVGRKVLAGKVVMSVEELRKLNEERLI